MPGQEPPAPVHLRLVGVVDCNAYSVVRLDMGAPAFRIVGVAFRASLHFADGCLEAGDQARDLRQCCGILPHRDGGHLRRQGEAASRQRRDTRQQGAAPERGIWHSLHRFR